MCKSFKGSFCIDVGILQVGDVGGEYLGHGIFIIFQFDVEPEDSPNGLNDVTPGVVVNGLLGAASCVFNSVLNLILHL